MKIFISWSGERSEALAKALREWLPLVLHYVEPWLSQSDIQAGERWSIEIAKELENSRFGVICVTRENLNSPWILFESGALAKSMQDGRVIPLLLDLDMKEISGPLAQFQAKKAENTGMRELIDSLNKAAPNPVPDAQLDRLFSALWPDLERQITSVPKVNLPTKAIRPQGEILEELVSSVRTVEMRFRDVIDDDVFLRKRRRKRFHPMMMHDLMYRIAEGPRDPVRILIFASLLRDEAPWVYELAVDAYRALTSGPRKDRRQVVRRFLEAFELLQRGPYLEELGIDYSFLKIIRSEFFDLAEFGSEEEIDVIEEETPAEPEVQRPSRQRTVRKRNSVDKKD